ncbi:MAG: GAF domain-containing protein, partial [Chloroflexi bacterium]|nr:GAF domain-containing protein [Chloroflexota bacterium]
MAKKDELKTTISQLKAQVAHLEAQNQQREAELVVTNRIGLLLTEAPDLRHVFEGARREIMSLIPTEGMSILLLTEDSQKLHWIYGYENDAEVDLSNIPPQPLTVGYSGRVVQTRQPLYLTKDDGAVREGLQTIIVGAESRAWLGLPLIAANKLTGVLVVENDAGFSERQLEFLQTITAPLAVAIENARLFESTHRLLAETRQRAAELTTINNISQAMATQSELDALIELVGEQVRTIFNADIMYVALHDQGPNIVYFPYLHGDVTKPRPFGKGLTEKIIQSGKPLLINRDMDKHHAEYQTVRIGIHSLSYLGVPITVNQQAIGVISVQSTTKEGRFNEADMHLLATIAANVGAAIHNAQLYTQTQRQATEMAALAEMGNEIATTLELLPVLERIMGRVKELTRVRDIALMLLEPDGSTFRTAVAMGDYVEALKANPILMGQGITGNIAQSGQAEFV